jgi:hypothetical protein
VIVSNVLSPGQIATTETNGIGQACPFPGPVAWWKAEGNATDSAGANNGTASGGVSYVPGEVGQNFSFDGLTGSVSVPDAPALRPQAITIEGWIKAQDVTGIHVIIGKRLGNATMDSYSMWIGSGVLFAAMSDSVGSGPFLTYPEFPSSSLFSGGDLVNFQAFAYQLQPAVPADPISQFLRSNLSPSTLTLLAAYSGGANQPLENALVNDLNRIIQGGSIYDNTRFAGVTLSPETLYILGRNPQGSDLVRLNRFLVRDAYPTDFATVVFPQLLNRFHVAYNFDPATQVQALYVNGALVDASMVNKTIDYDAHSVLIGADDDNGSPGFFYQGEIDELTIYNRALTGTEIQAIYNAGTAGKCTLPGAISLGDLPNGATAQVSFAGTPIACPTVSATAVVTSGTPDPNLANNSASVSIPVQDILPTDVRLAIERVSIFDNNVRITWPLTCSPFTLESVNILGQPWAPAGAPLQIINNFNATVVPADQATRFFKVRFP